MQETIIKAALYVGIIVFGYVIQQRGILGPKAFDTLSKTVICITLPCAIISYSTGQSINASILTIVLISFVSGITYMGFGCLLARKKGRSEKAFYVSNISSYNISTFTLPFTQNFLGPVGVVITSLFDIGNSFICLVSTYGTARVIKDGSKLDILKVLRSPLFFIPFFTHLCMVAINLLKLNIPAPILTFASVAANANAFLSLLLVGVGLKLSGYRNKLGTIAKILSVRFGFAAVLALCWYYLLPFDLLVRKALVILTFAPIGYTIPVFSKEPDSDVGLSDTIHSVSIIISIVVIVMLLTVML